jgi:hypothetical protein
MGGKTVQAKLAGNRQQLLATLLPALRSRTDICFIANP